MSQDTCIVGQWLLVEGQLIWSWSLAAPSTTSTHSVHSIESFHSETVELIAQKIAA